MFLLEEWILWSVIFDNKMKYLIAMLIKYLISISIHNQNKYLRRASLGGTEVDIFF